MIVLCLVIRHYAISIHTVGSSTTAQVFTVHLRTAISAKIPTSDSLRGKAHLHHSASPPGVPFRITLSALRLP
eukprot:IDg20171t1